MTSLDGDWICDEDELDDSTPCFAVWQHCDECEDGLVPAGTGLPIIEGSLWFDTEEHRSGKYDVCGECIGSGGAYVCGFHDLGTVQE